MKRIVAVCVVLVIAGILYALHFLTTATWDGGKKVILRLHPESLASEVTRVGYWSYPYKGLTALVDSYGRIPLEEGQSLLDILPADLFPEAKKMDAATYSLLASASGKRSLLWSYYEYWSDGVLIRVDFADGRALIIMKHVDLEQETPELTLPLPLPNQSMQQMASRDHGSCLRTCRATPSHC